jgi:hypothetical protein
MMAQTSSIMGMGAEGTTITNLIGNFSLILVTATQSQRLVLFKLKAGSNTQDHPEF